MAQSTKRTRNVASKNSVSSTRTRKAERMLRRKAKVMASRNSLGRGIAALRIKTKETSDSKGIKASDN